MAFWTSSSSISALASRVDVSSTRSKWAKKAGEPNVAEEGDNRVGMGEGEHKEEVQRQMAGGSAGEKPHGVGWWYLRWFWAVLFE